MNDKQKNRGQINRADIRVKRYLTPIEFTLLDQLFFRDNLVGYNHHIRVLADETSVSTGKTSQVIAKFPFVKKEGTTKNMRLIFDYEGALQWQDRLIASKGIVHPVNNHSGYCSRAEQSGGIVHGTNNDCSPGEPTSTGTNNVHVPDMTSEDSSLPEEAIEGIEEDINNGGIDCPERAERAVPSAAGILSMPPSEGKSMIVHPVNNKMYVLAPEPMSMPLPSSIKNIPSAVRQKKVVDMVKRGTGFNLTMDTEKGSNKDGFNILAYDDDGKAILFTADDAGFISNRATQALCSHFRSYKYTVMVWLADNQALYGILSAKRGNL